MFYVYVSCSQILRKLKGALDIEIMSCQYKDDQDFFIPHKCLQEIQEDILLFKKYPKMIKAPKVRIKPIYCFIYNLLQMILLHGPQGCGKTETMERLATTLGWKSFKRNGANIFNRFHGESEKNIDEVWYHTITKVMDF